MGRRSALATSVERGANSAQQRVRVERLGEYFDLVVLEEPLWKRVASRRHEVEGDACPADDA